MLQHMKVNQLDTPAAAPCQAFAYKAGTGWLAMLHSSLVQAAKAMAARVGLDPSAVAGHSFRRGGASFAFQAGVPDVLIQRQGDWLSSCYREYIVLAPEKALCATRMMLRLMSTPSASVGLQEGVAPADNVSGPLAALVRAVEAPGE